MLSIVCLWSCIVRLFSFPYNALQWEPNGSRSKWEFQCKL